MNRRVFPLAAVILAMLALPSLAADLAVGAKAPEFKGLEGVDGKKARIDDFKDAKVLIVCFTCNECPVAADYQNRFIDFNKKYKELGVAFVAVNSNIGRPDEENLKGMKERAAEMKYNFPYLFDASGKLADDYGAKTTPHLFVFDTNRTLQYSGAFDDKQKVAKVTKTYVADAVDALLAGKTPPIVKTKPFGCGIYNKLEE